MNQLEIKIKKKEQYEEEKEELIKREKSIFIESLNAISSNIAKKKSVENFLKATKKKMNLSFRK